MQSSVCNHEAARLEALHRYNILDTPPEQAFDDLVSLAAQICDTPIALINLIDANRQWFKAKVGLDIQEMPINIGLCRFCIQQTDTLIIPNTLADERFATEVVVTSKSICEILCWCTFDRTRRGGHRDFVCHRHRTTPN